MSLVRRDFSLGWSPDFDATNAPAEALLRADNLILDDLGILSLRRGCSRINPGAPLSQTDVHSLFTIYRSGTKVRYAGAGNKVFRNAVTPLSPTFDGSGDISFGSHLGQVFFARGTIKVKDDGTTLRNWGIQMTGGAPSISGPVAADTKQFATWDSGETGHTVEEAESTTPSYDEGYDGSSSGAIKGNPLVESNRFVVVRALPGPTDFTTLTGGGQASDDDIIKMWMYVSNPDVVVKIALLVDCNGGKFAKDTYLKEWSGAGAAGADGTVSNPGVPGTPGPGEIGSGEPPLV